MLNPFDCLHFLSRKTEGGGGGCCIYDMYHRAFVSHLISCHAYAMLSYLTTQHVHEIYTIIYTISTFSTTLFAILPSFGFFFTFYFSIPTTSSAKSPQRCLNHHFMNCNLIFPLKLVAYLFCVCFLFLNAIITYANISFLHVLPITNILLYQ